MNQMDLSSVRWSFTAWKEPSTKLHLVDYMIWQSEICPTTKAKHYQGYVEFKKEYTGKFVKSLFKDKTIHIEVSREDRRANRLYCSKKDTRSGETFEYTDHNCAIMKTAWDDFPIE